MYVLEVIWFKECIFFGVIGCFELVCMIGLWLCLVNYFICNNWVGCLYVDGVVVFDLLLNNVFVYFVNFVFFLFGLCLFEIVEIVIEEVDFYCVYVIELFDIGVVCVVLVEGVCYWFGVSYCCWINCEFEFYFEGFFGCIEWWYE